MKKLVFVCMILVCTLIFTSCGIKLTEVSEIDNTEQTEIENEQQQNSTDTSETNVEENEENDSGELYKDVLDRYYNYLYYKVDSFGTGEGLAAEEFYYDLEKDNAEIVGYSFKDINNDGIFELLVGGTQSVEGLNQIFAAYTLVDNEPVLLFEGWSRSRYYLTEDNEFYYEGSSSAAESNTAIYYVDENGNFTLKSSYFTKPNEDWTQIHYFYTTDDEQFLEFNPDDLDELYPQFNESREKRCFVELIPFSQHTVSEENVILPPSVSGKWSNEVEEDVVINNTFVPNNADEYQKIVYFAEEDVTDFKILSVEYEGYDENYQEIYSANELYNVGDFKKGQAMLAGLITFEYMPRNGISYVDKAGKERRFYVTQSGEDGSVMLVEF